MKMVEMFLLNFDSSEGKMNALNEGPLFFDQKPLILKEWSPDLRFEDIQLSKLPVWVKFPRLPLSMWNSKALSKIASVCGKPIQSDQCTRERTKLGFARVLIEMDLNLQFPDVIQIYDDQGRLVEQTVVYEWMPSLCKKCNKLVTGHHSCAQSVKQVWRQKEVVPVQDDDTADGSKVKLDESKKDKQLLKVDTTQGTEMNVQVNVKKGTEIFLISSSTSNVSHTGHTLNVSKSYTVASSSNVNQLGAIGDRKVVKKNLKLPDKGKGYCY